MLFAKTPVGSVIYIPVLNKTKVVVPFSPFSPNQLVTLCGFWMVVDQLSLVTIYKKPFYVNGDLSYLTLFINTSRAVGLQDLCFK